MKSRILWSLVCRVGSFLAVFIIIIACGGVYEQVQPEFTSEPGEIMPTAPLPTKGISATAQPAILEARRLVLEWPPTIRVGDSDLVRLTLDMDTQGNVTPTVETEGHETETEIIQIPNLYNTHRVFAEARLDMAGLEVKPSDLVSQPLLPGHTVTFSWSISPDKASTYRGIVWFKLRYIPLQGGAESEQAISAQTIEIRGVNFLGISGTPARILGGVGTLLGSVISLDSLLPWLWKRIRRKPK